MDVFLYNDLKFHSVYQNVVLIKESGTRLTITQEAYRESDEDGLPYKWLNETTINKKLEGITVVEVRE